MLISLRKADLELFSINGWISQTASYVAEFYSWQPNENEWLATFWDWPTYSFTPSIEWEAASQVQGQTLDTITLSNEVPYRIC